MARSNFAVFTCCAVLVGGVARGEEPEFGPEPEIPSRSAEPTGEHPELKDHPTTSEAPEEHPQEAKGGLLEALPKIQRATAGLAGAHTPTPELMVDFFDLARSRMGSGTSWMPSSSPIYGLMTRFGRDWGFMARGNIFAGYNWFSSERGGKRFISTNSLLFMVWHRLGRGEILPRMILSWEAFTIRDGYALVGQTGDSSHPARFRDRQHPHDLFSELAVMYSFKVHEEIAMQVYLAVAGAPALGPNSYLYRDSAVSDPLAPLGYSAQDAPRVSAPVVTVGVFTRELKFEVSWFNGRGHDGRFWDIDLDLPDSFATRLTYNPRPNWSAQASYGYLRGPDPRRPDLSVHRLTTSATYNVRRGPEANWASTVVLGENLEEGGAHVTTCLAETNWNIDGHNTIYARLEYADKFARNLIVEETGRARRVRVGMLGVGYAYYFRPLLSLAPALGARFSMVPLDARLEPLYGTRLAVGILGYLQIRPSALVLRDTNKGSAPQASSLP